MASLERQSQTGTWNTMVFHNNLAVDFGFMAMSVMVCRVVQISAFKIVRHKTFFMGIYSVSKSYAFTTSYTTMTDFSSEWSSIQKKDFKRLFHTVQWIDSCQFLTIFVAFPQVNHKKKTKTVVSIIMRHSLSVKNLRLVI